MDDAGQRRTIVPHEPRQPVRGVLVARLDRLDFPLGFNFPFFQNSFSTIHISAEGYAGFSQAGFGTSQNVAIPSAALPNNIICPLWDDFFSNVGGDVFYQLLQNPTRFIIQWNNVRRTGATTGSNRSSRSSRGYTACSPTRCPSSRRRESACSPSADARL